MATQPSPQPFELRPYGNFIGGRWLPAASGRVAESRNPADESELVGMYAYSDERDVKAAVRAAAEAYRVWSALPVPARARYLRDVGRLLDERREALARIITQETGKPIGESPDEVRDSVNFAYYVAEEGRRFFGRTIPSEMSGRFCYTVRVPLGVVGLITPWNYPLIIPAWKIFPALLAGNTAVFKPASDTPLVAAWLVETFEEAGIPAGVLNLVTGNGDEAGWPLVEHPEVRAISFTGFLDNGWRIGARCAELHKRVSLELGGKNALIVLPDADLDLAVEGAVRSAFSACGQMCTATGRLLVHRDVADEFTQRFHAKVAAMKVGPGSDPSVDIGPVINRRQLERIARYIRIGREEGARLLCGGEALAGPEYEAGHFLAPTIFTDVRPDMTVAREEIFGPVALIMPADSLEQAIEVANATPYGLAASVYTRDLASAMRAVEGIRAGVVYVNGPTSDAEPQLPFGGVRSSGNGAREAGPAMLDEFTEWKTVSLDFGSE